MKKRRLNTWRWTALFSVAASVLSSSPANASGDTTGTVVTIITSSPGYALVQLSAAPGGTRPGCASQPSYAGAVNVTTQQGQAMLATLLTARALGASVRVTGANTCSVSGTTEDAYAVYLTSAGS